MNKHLTSALSELLDSQIICSIIKVILVVETVINHNEQQLVNEKAHQYGRCWGTETLVVLIEINT